MNLKEISLMQKLINCTVSGTLDYTSSIIAQYLLLNYANLGELSSNQVSSACFVSLSSVRRFCVKLGYENFSDLVKAKLSNPEDQQVIAKYNLDCGYYKPADLRNNINDATYTVFRSIKQSRLQQTASGILKAKALILFCTRPYNMWLREFQNQVIAWGFPVYIIEDAAHYQEIIQNIGSDLYTILVSPMAYLVEPFYQECREMAGRKSAVLCHPFAEEPVYQEFLSIYDTILDFRLKNYSYEYLEVYGKYSVAYLFDMLLGEMLPLLIKRSVQYLPQK